MNEEGVSGSSQIRGTLGAVSLVELIQSLHASGHTGELELSKDDGDSQGRILLYREHIVHAVAGDRVGIDALVDLLGWTEGEYLFTPGVRALWSTVGLPVQQALDEAVRLRGEIVVATDESLPVGGEESSDSTPDSKVPTTGEYEMNTKKLAPAIDSFRERLGTALISCDIWGPDGLSLAGFNPKPEAVALFGDITTRLVRSLADGNFPSLGRYYLLELTDKKIVCVLVYRNHQWGALVDMDKVNMGMLISIAIPKALEDLRQAVDG